MNDSDVKNMSFDISEDLMKRFPTYKKDWLMQKAIWEFWERQKGSNFEREE